MRSTLLSTLFIAGLASTALAAESPPPSVASPEIIAFLGADGFGAAHPDAPPEGRAFARLVGLWRAEVEIRGQDGSWARDGAALWAWQYALDGFATQDLWFQSIEDLSSYLRPLGRPYMLTGLRIFEPGSGRWRIAWAANGAGKIGVDFGTLDGEMRGEDVVLTSETQFGHQRITFSEITDDSFLWTSEMSRDGESWTAVMRVRARRLE